MGEVLTIRPSHQAEGLEAGRAVAADDQVVVDGDAHGAGRLDDLAGHVHVGGRGRRIARWVVVDHPYGPHNVLIYMIYFA